MPKLLKRRTAVHLRHGALIIEIMCINRKSGYDFMSRRGLFRGLVCLGRHLEVPGRNGLYILIPNTIVKEGKKKKKQ